MKWTDAATTGTSLKDLEATLKDLFEQPSGLKPDVYLLPKETYEAATSPCEHGEPQMINCVKCWSEYWEFERRQALAAKGATP